MSVTARTPSIYAPGADVSATATADVTARRFLKISGNRDADRGLISVAPAAAGDRTCGVAARDAATGELVTLIRGASRVVWVRASGAIAAGAEVQVGANGTAATYGAGVAVGYAITGAADATDAEISLYA